MEKELTHDLPGGRPGGTAAWTSPAVYAVLFVLCLVTFHGITDNYLFNDDFSWMSSARYEMTLRNIFTYRVVDFFRPLVNVTFYAFERLAPGNIRLQYTFDLLLHFICSVLVFHIFIPILGDWRKAAAGAVLFAVSSIHTGAVFWISARTTLLSTALLLAGILVMIGPGGREGRRVAAASAVFVLSLLAKETAIAGLPILLFLYLIYRKEWDSANVLKRSLAPWAIISIAYLVTRQLVIGGFAKHDWSPGLHMLRNIAGGFLYELRPWPFFSLFWHEGTAIREPSHPFLPELLATGAVAFLWWAGRATGKSRESALGTLWALAALVPASAFRYRFYSTVSITQNRYYYLSSVGVILLFALALGLMWDTRKRLLRVLAAVILAVYLAGSMVRVDRLEKVWSGFTGMYRESVDLIVSSVDDHPGYETAALEDPPLAFPYVAEAVSLYRPGWKVFRVEGGAGSAEEYAPCVYIHFSYDGDRVDRVDVRVLE